MGKNPAAVALGRLSGKNLTEEERIERARKAGEMSGGRMTPKAKSERARKAAIARWGNKAQQNGTPPTPAALSPARRRNEKHGPKGLVSSDESNHIRDIKRQSKKGKA